MHFIDQEVIMFIMFCAFWVFSSVSFAVFITYKILNRYTNFGDSSSKIDEYSLRGIDLIRCRDNVPSSDKYHLFADYGMNPYENNKHRIPEQLLKNKE